MSSQIKIRISIKEYKRAWKRTKRILCYLVEKNKSGMEETEKDYLSKELTIAIKRAEN